MIVKRCNRALFDWSFTIFRSRPYSSAAASAEAKVSVPLDVGQPSVSAPSDDVRSISPRVENLLEQILNLPLLEVSDLNYALKKRLNIPDTPFMPAGMMMSAPVAAAAAPAAAAEEPAAEKAPPQKISFAVKLTKFDDSKKIALIKQIRDLMPGLNLVQAKKFVESAPVEVKADLGQNEADELKATLAKVGGTCEIV